jgi:hypothetical protein
MNSGNEAEQRRRDARSRLTRWNVNDASGAAKLTSDRGVNMVSQSTDTVCQRDIACAPSASSQVALFADKWRVDKDTSVNRCVFVKIACQHVVLECT